MGIGVKKSAKSCKKFGLNKKFYKVYHRCHINKVMMTAFTAFAFEDCIENGGGAVKLGIFRAQSFKVAEREVRESVRQADGSMKQTGSVKRNKDDLYLVDCAVTGSSDGTSKDPKCALQRIFEHCIFPAVRKLAEVGGRYEVYTPVCQGDGAGSHVEAEFLNFI